MKTTSDQLSAPNPSTPEATKPSLLLEMALKSFGPKGEKWTPDGRFCSIVALTMAADKTGTYGTCFPVAYSCLQSATGSYLVSTWNDHATWPQVKTALKKAARLARKAERAQ